MEPDRGRDEGRAIGSHFDPAPEQVVEGFGVKAFLALTRLQGSGADAVVAVVLGVGLLFYLRRRR